LCGRDKEAGEEELLPAWRLDTPWPVLLLRKPARGLEPGHGLAWASVPLKEAED
jgi:hypothetical protein